MEISSSVNAKSAAKRHTMYIIMLTNTGANSCPYALQVNQGSFINLTPKTYYWDYTAVA